MQLDHYSTNFIQRRFPIVLVCDNITNAPNIGSLFRIADAFGIEKLMLCGEHIVLGRKMTKTSRATEKIVPFEILSDATNKVNLLKKEGYQIVSIEITSDSLPIRNHTFNLDKPIAIVIGDENFGVSEGILKQSDTIIHIDMFGQNTSMNVVQAVNIALYEITKQLM